MGEKDLLLAWKTKDNILNTIETQNIAISVFCDVIWAQNDVIKGVINFLLHWNEFGIKPKDSTNDFQSKEGLTTHQILSKLKMENFSEFGDVIGGPNWPKMYLNNL